MVQPITKEFQISNSGSLDSKRIEEQRSEGTGESKDAEALLKPFEDKKFKDTGSNGEFKDKEQKRGKSS